MNRLKRLLLLEDNPDDALLIRELLQENYGSEITIDHAVSATEATQLAQQNQYDLFLVDYMLGEPPNGAEWITQTAKTITLPPIIMLTGLPDTQRVETIASTLSEVSYFVTKDHLRSGALIRAINFVQINQPTSNNIKGTILLADDDADDVMLVEDALLELKSQFRLDVVEDGVTMMDYLYRRESYSNLKGTPLPGLILLDLNMPRMDGRQVLSTIKNDPQLSRIPVVILSTSTAEQDVRDCYDLGANSFASKPATFDGLVTMMRSLTTYWFDLVTISRTQ